MKNSLQAISLPALLRRWRSLDNRDLWGLLAALFALYLLLLSLLTQPPDEMLNLVLVMGGALLVLHAPPAGWQPRPGRIGRSVGVTLLVAMLWLGQRLMNSDFIFSLLPLLGRDCTGPAGGAREQTASLPAFFFGAGAVAGCPCSWIADSTRPPIGGDRLAHPADPHTIRLCSRALWKLGRPEERRGHREWRLRRFGYPFAAAARGYDLCAGVSDAPSLAKRPDDRGGSLDRDGRQRNAHHAVGLVDHQQPAKQAMVVCFLS